MSLRDGLLTIGGTIGLLGLLTAATACSEGVEKPELPIRIVCIENGSVVLDEFVDEGKGGSVYQNNGYISYRPGPDGQRSYAMGTCSIHPQTIPADWKRVYPGA